VLLNGGAPAIAFGIHATTACLLVVVAGVLLYRRFPKGGPTRDATRTLSVLDLRTHM
jgi:hypothetical protein